MTTIMRTLALKIRKNYIPNIRPLQIIKKQERRNKTVGIPTPGVFPFRDEHSQERRDDSTPSCIPENKPLGNSDPEVTA